MIEKGDVLETGTLGGGGIAGNNNSQSQFDTLEEYHKNNEESHFNSQEARISHEQYNRIIVVEFICMFFSAYGICMAITLNELAY